MGGKTRTAAMVWCSALLALYVAAMAAPAWALPPTFKGALEIIAPVDGKPHADILPGTISGENGVWQLSYGLHVPGATPSALSTVSIRVDIPHESAVVSRSQGTAQQSVGEAQLVAIPFSLYARKPTALAALPLVSLFIGSRAQFIRYGVYEGRTVKVYAFRERGGAYGQILFSPEFGLPLKIDTFDPVREVRTIVKIEDPSL